MANVFSKNAYNILSLVPGAKFKDINHKAKEIIKLSKIDEEDFRDSISLLVPDRDEPAINKALDDLSSPKKKIKEYFFWFDNNDDDDNKFIEFLKYNKYEDAIKFYKTIIRGDGIDDLLKKKNLAILQTLLLLNNNFSYLSDSIIIWKEVLASDKYWKSFKKIYETNNDEDIDFETIESFRKEVPNYLADVYFDASDNNKKVFSEFRKFFNTKGVTVDKKVTRPALNATALSIENLEKMKISEDGVISDDEIKAVSTAIQNIQQQFNKLIDYDIYDDSEVRVLRDRAASVIRDIVLDIHNELDETEKSIKLINIALTLAGTTPLVNKLNKDLDILKDVLSQKNLISPINNLIESKDYDGAIVLIKNALRGIKNDDAKYSGFCEMMKSAVSMKLMALDKEAFDAFNDKEWSIATGIFEEMNEFADKNIDYFNFNKKALIEYFNNQVSRANEVNVDTVSTIDTITQSARDSAKKNFPDMWEQYFIIASVDAKVMPRGIYLIKRLRVVNSLYRAGGLTWWLYGLGFVLYIIGWIYKRSS